jgi:molybdenum cofactor synthesis domain-containing protein
LAVEVEIICIGNELLIGKIQDTNAHWLGAQATALGANVKRITVIQDIIPEIAQTINEALSRKPRFLITTGGLGPTFDDKTFQGVAAALNQKLVVNPEALEMVKSRMIEYFKKHQLPIDAEMTPPRVKMAIFPEKTQPVVNPIGTAPGLRAEVGCTTLFSMPGVPREMEAIFNQTIAPMIKEAVGGCGFCQRSLYVEGVGESRLAPLIDRIMADNVGVYVKSHPLGYNNGPCVELHLTMVATQITEPEKLLARAADELDSLIRQSGGSVKDQAL